MISKPLSVSTSAGAASNQHDPNRSRNEWLDIARLLAMAMVAAQHSLSVCDIRSPTIFFRLDLGQFGVAIFFSLSGFWAVQGKNAGAVSWLKKRFSRIFVPYWLALTGVFFANFVYAYKPVSMPLVVSEYLGIAGWTHRSDLVGVHFWFISLLLGCYTVAAIFRTLPRSFPVIFAATIVWLWYDPWFAGHTLAFLTGAAFGVTTNRPEISKLVVTALCATLLATVIHSGFAGVAVGSVTLICCSIPFGISRRIASRITHASDCSYHFYLVHGPIYLAVAALVTPSILGVAFLGTLASFSGAIILKKAESAVRSAIAIFGRLTPRST